MATRLWVILGLLGWMTGCGWDAASGPPPCDPGEPGATCADAAPPDAAPDAHGDGEPGDEPEPGEETAPPVDGDTDALADLGPWPDVGSDVSPDLDAPPMPEGYVIDCAAAPMSIYQNPDADVVAAAQRGAVFSCADDGSWPAAAFSAQAGEMGLEAETGLRRLRISYRTERAAGVPGVGTASILLPEPVPSEAMDVVIVAHGTAGLADHCAPSRYPGYFDSMSLAFATQGFAVIAPDYAGLGNDGTQGYGDAEDTAHSLLDAPGALRDLLAAGLLSQDVAVVGHSQGGGAALHTQALASSYGMDGTLGAAVNFAGSVITETEVDPGLFQWAGFYPANYASGTSGAFGALLLYSYGANDVDPPDPGVFFHEDFADEIVGWVDSYCIFDLFSPFAALDSALMFDDVFSPDFYAGVLACIAEDPSCGPPYEGYLQRLVDGVLPSDPEGAPVLIHAGLGDTIVLPAQIACTEDAMTAWGLTPTTCVSTTADHMTVVTEGLAHAVSWVQATLAGNEAPACPTPTMTLPPCAAF